MITHPGKRPSLAPGNWLAWIAVGLLWLLGRLPQRVALALSVPLGAAMRLAMRRRREIATRNIERCFPQLTVTERQALARQCFIALARAVFEIAWCWTAPDRRIARMAQLQGLEHLEAARARGRGVLVLTAHMTCLEMGGRILGRAVPAAGIYRPLRNPVIEWYQNRGRLAYGKGLISKRDVRSAVRYLKAGGVIWYAPDQDFGAEQSAFAPFFGIPTATLLATHRLVQLTGCALVPMFPAYDERSRRYELRFLPELRFAPGEDVVTSLTRVNQALEEQVRSRPEQYWWIHRRFKTRPPGEPPFYD